MLDKEHGRHGRTASAVYVTSSVCIMSSAKRFSFFPNKALNEPTLRISKWHCFFGRKGAIVKIPVLVALLVVGLLAALGLIFIVL